MAIKITGEVVIGDSTDGSYIDMGEQYTAPAGLRRIRHKLVTRESDFYNDRLVQYSDDNGRTWSGEESVYGDDFLAAPDGSWEIMNHSYTANIYNPVHKHFVGMGMQRIFKGGRDKAYHEYWSNGQRGFSDHCFLMVRGENEETAVPHFIKYESGADFDPENPLDGNYFNTNIAYFSIPFVAKNGDVLFAFGPPVSTCCRILGVDPHDYFPNYPDNFCGLIVGRAVWNGEHYDFTFSRPAVISNLQSSRGIDEPMVAELESGRILVVFRGSNVQAPNWKTRIEPGTPGFKWYCYSDDGGKTFTNPAPWHFDDGEVIYSSATFSQFLRANSTGKLYWVGNMTGHIINGNYPRWPLNIVEVDENYGTAKKDSLTVIDTKRDWESADLQLSNFTMLEDRESGDIELWLAKIGQYSNKEVYRAETWKYRINITGKL